MQKSRLLLNKKTVNDEVKLARANHPETSNPPRALHTETRHHQIVNFLRVITQLI